MLNFTSKSSDGSLYLSTTAEVHPHHKLVLKVIRVDDMIEISAKFDIDYQQGTRSKINSLCQSMQDSTKDYRVHSHIDGTRISNNVIFLHYIKSDITLPEQVEKIQKFLFHFCSFFQFSKENFLSIVEVLKLHQNDFPLLTQNGLLNEPEPEVNQAETVAALQAEVAKLSDRVKALEVALNDKVPQSTSTSFFGGPSK